MPGSNSWVESRDMRCGPSCTERNEPTPWPVPWAKSPPAFHRLMRASGSRSQPRVPFGKRAVLIAIMPLRTSVKKRLRSEEHTSELQSLMRISYADFCLKKKHPNLTSKHDLRDYASTPHTDK